MPSKDILTTEVVIPDSGRYVVSNVVGDNLILSESNCHFKKLMSGDPLRGLNRNIFYSPNY